MKLSAIIVAGGMGTRLGAPIPKAFIELGGIPLFIHSLKVFSSHISVNEIKVIVPSGYIEETQKIIGKFNITGDIIVTPGGKERWNSVKNGIDISKNSDWVMIHDAARPFVTAKIINSLLKLANQNKSIITATSMVDTVRLFEDNLCKETIDRSKLLRVGTPQLFHKKTLIEAFCKAEEMDITPTDEAMLMEQIGIQGTFAWGDPLNFKITTSEDREMAEAIIYQKKNKNA